MAILENIRDRNKKRVIISYFYKGVYRQVTELRRVKKGVSDRNKIINQNRKLTIALNTLLNTKAQTDFSNFEDFLKKAQK